MGRQSADLPITGHRVGKDCVPGPKNGSQHPSHGAGPGDIVRVRGALWRLRDVTAYADCRALNLDQLDAGAAGVRRVLLFPFDRPEVVPRTSGWRLVSKRRWSRHLLRLLRGTGPGDSLTALAAAGIDLLPYQVEPALAILHGLASRVLLADEVGLGKTIQAALVLAEGIARGRIHHALIVTPAGLRDQWSAELRTRFGVESTVVDAQWLRQSTQQWPPTVNPWTIPAVVITSLDFVKRPENLGALSTVTWDLFILDEAHSAARGTDRGAAAAELASRARTNLLLTATPHSGEGRAFEDLCRIGALSPGEPIALFRRTRDAGHRVRRHLHVLRVRPTHEEQEMHDVLAAYASRVWDAVWPERSRGGRLAVVVLLKRAASSASSLERSVEYRRARLSGDAPWEPIQLGLPLEDEDRADDEPGEGLEAPGLPDAAEEGAWLARLSEAAARAASRESKLGALSRLLGRTSEPVVVFTEFRDTLRRIAGLLAPSVECALLHGGLDRDARRDALRRFESGSARVLLATDAGGEGLNLQSRCRIVVNVELPWNPIRLEQRIGRVDRIGQRRTVHAMNLVANATFETSLMAKLATRVGRARAALGSVEDPLGVTDEIAIADAVIRDTDLPDLRGETDVPPGSSGVPIVVPRLLERARAECARAAQWRTWRLGPACGPDRVTWSAGDRTQVCVIPRRRLLRGLGRAGNEPGAFGGVAASAGVVCVFVARYVDRGGRLVEESLIPLEGRGAVPCIRTRADQRNAIASILAVHGPALCARARCAAELRLAEIAASCRAGAASPRDREIALAQSVRQASRLAGPKQIGLFDRRADRDREDFLSILEARRRASHDRLCALDAASVVSLAAGPELAFFLVVSG